MIMGSGESPHLTSLYHEVLSINTELTTLVRELTRERTALTRTVSRLLVGQELRPTPTVTEHSVAERLAELRPALLAQVADQLASALPMIGTDSYDPGRAANHHAQMLSTVQRFHDLVQLGTTVDWSLVEFECAWASRMLRSKGGIWNHQAFLSETYFSIARRLVEWSDDERAILAEIASHLYTDGASAYDMAIDADLRV
jgi:hypothetical protein